MRYINSRFTYFYLLTAQTCVALMAELHAVFNADFVFVAEENKPIWMQAEEINVSRS